MGDRSVSDPSVSEGYKGVEWFGGEMGREASAALRTFSLLSLGKRLRGKSRFVFASPIALPSTGNFRELDVVSRTWSDRRSVSTGRMDL